MDGEERLRQRLLVAFGLLIGLPTLPWYALMFLRDPEIRLPRMVALAAILINAFAPLLLRLLPTRAVAWIAVGNLHIAVAVNVLMNQGLAGPNAVMVTCLPVVTAVLLGVSYGWGNAVLLVLSAIALEATLPPSVLPTTAPPEIWPLARLMSLAIAVSIMLVAVSSFFSLLRSQAATMRRLAHSDTLTGLDNRHQVLSIMPAEMAQLERRWTGQEVDERRTLGFLLLDLDDFKRINDTWSHAAGDRALEAVADALTRATRRSDVVARWGGEEFLVVLRDVEPSGIATSVRRLLAAVRALRVPAQPGGDLKTELGSDQGGSGDGGSGDGEPPYLDLACTIGYTHVPAYAPLPAASQDESWMPYLDLADRALLSAKRDLKGGGLGFLWPLEIDAAPLILEPREVLADLPGTLERGLLKVERVAPERSSAKATRGTVRGTIEGDSAASHPIDSANTASRSSVQPGRDPGLTSGSSAAHRGQSAGS